MIAYVLVGLIYLGAMVVGCLSIGLAASIAEKCDKWYKAVGVFLLGLGCFFFTAAGSAAWMLLVVQKYR